MELAAWQQFVKTLCAEKLTIQQQIGIYHIKNLDVNWVIFAAPEFLVCLTGASELYSGLEKFKDNLQFVEDRSTLTWHLRATIKDKRLKLK